MGRLEEKRVALRILGIGVDTGTPTGRLMVNLLGSIAQFEREVMLERQREGIAKAKAEGRCRGRKPTARAMAAHVMEMQREGVTKEAIATKLGIGVASVYRVLRDASDHARSRRRAPVMSGIRGKAAATSNGRIVSDCEGLRMPADRKGCHVLIGRRPQASKEGTRGEEEALRVSFDLWRFGRCGWGVRRRPMRASTGMQGPGGHDWRVVLVAGGGRRR